MKHPTAAGVFVCALACTAFAHAQTGKPDPAKPVTPKAQETTKSTVAPADRTFARQAAMDSMAEVAHGQLAAQKATHADVKQFGQRMVDDHSKANDELKSWASANNVELPADMGAQHKAMQARLEKLTGEAFDRTYTSHMVQAHAKAVAAFQRESKSKGNADLKAWVDKTLPTLQEHHKLARDIDTKVGKAATSGRKGGAKQ